MHVAELMLIFSGSSEIGKNIPLVHYPVRVRVIDAPLTADHLTSTTTRAKSPSSKPATQLPPPAASVTEGKLEQSEKVYKESSSARYFTASELDSRPAVIAVPDLELMDIGPSAEGVAILQLFINENGEVDRITIEQSTLPDVMVEQLQLQHKQLQFMPGSKNGINVKSVVIYKVELAKIPIITVLPGTYTDTSLVEK